RGIRWRNRLPVPGSPGARARRPRPPRTRRSPRGRGCRARTAAPRSRSFYDPLWVDCGRGAVDIGVVMTFSIIPPDLHDPFWVLHWLSRGSLLGAVVEALAIAILVAQRSLFEHVAAVGAALASGGLLAGRTAVGHIVGRDPTRLDAPGVARAALESLAENFSD